MKKGKRLQRAEGITNCWFKPFFFKTYRRTGSNYMRKSDSADLFLRFLQQDLQDR
jgi:hypothetical protein